MHEQIAVIGAGPLGRWLAREAARAGYRVLLEDVMPSNLTHAAEELRQELAQQAGGAGVGLVSTIEDAVRQADLVIDCVPDELESKLEILWLLDRMAPPRAVLATPTVRQSIRDLAACTYRPDRCVGLAVDPRGLTRPGVGAASPAGTPAPVRVRITPQTSVDTQALVAGFFERLGILAVFELEDGANAWRPDSEGRVINAPSS
ncbi:MAG: 3-hydroxyacyl-CoA dehydrogenase NAD-binding domain-containing protein [Terracidiphilus sp.]